MRNKISLIEDHHEALRIWREEGFKNLSLVHVDAHIDFGFQLAKPLTRVLNEARSLKELKRNLEYTLAFRHYENDFDKQTNIGNYIYPAMSEGIVKDFYWVVPGGIKEFKVSLKFIKGMISGLSGNRAARSTLKDGIISTQLLGRKFVICILEKLPVLKQRILLDIDTDFMVVDSLLNANNTAKIGKRKPWILPQDLVRALKQRIKKPQVITIAYSVNGGYTPMRYKVLGDELAYRFSPKHFKARFRRKFTASSFFGLFESSGKKEYYQKAVKLNPGYRAADNNYGALYLNIRKFSKAKKEFLRIAKVDPKNPYPSIDMGNIALEKGKSCEAKRYFSYALKLKKNLKQALIGLAQAEFRLNNFKKAERLFLGYQKSEPLQPQSRYFLGRIYEKQRNFKQAVICYQDALRLGLNNIEVIYRLLKNACYLKEKDDIIKYIWIRYKEFKKGFYRAKRLGFKKGKKIRGLREIKKKMAALERRLQEVRNGMKKRDKPNEGGG